MVIHNLELERQLLAGIIRNQEIFADIDGYVDESDFKNKLHQVIFGVIRQTARGGNKIDKIQIAQKINQLSLSFEDKISSVLDYLNEICLIQINANIVKSLADELKTVSLRRDIFETGRQISESMIHTADKTPEEIVGVADKLYTKVVNSFKPANEPVDLFGFAEDYINSMDNDVSSEEIACPYPLYQKYFGGFSKSDLVVFAAPAKAGKTSLLLDMLIKITQNPNDNVRALMIDTEMETYRLTRRLIASISGVNEYLIKSKKWREDKNLVERVKYAINETRKFMGRIDHIYVGNQSTEYMASILRRWHWKQRSQEKKGENLKLIGCLDYFKLTGRDDIKDAFSASIGLGVRVDYFKKLAAELEIPILSSAQTNRSQDIGLSHEICKFASSVFKFQRRTTDEILRDGGEATHKLTPLFTRDLGEHGDGASDLVRVGREKGRDIWIENYIGYKMKDFHLTEIGDLKSMHKELAPVSISEPVKRDSLI
jgi:replicative DNA helicase